MLNQLFHEVIGDIVQGAQKMARLCEDDDTATYNDPDEYHIRLTRGAFCLRMAYKIWMETKSLLQCQENCRLAQERQGGAAPPPEQDDYDEEYDEDATPAEVGFDCLIRSSVEDLRQAMQQLTSTELRRLYELLRLEVLPRPHPAVTVPVPPPPPSPPEKQDG